MPELAAGDLIHADAVGVAQYCRTVGAELDGLPDLIETTRLNGDAKCRTEVALFEAAVKHVSDDTLEALIDFEFVLIAILGLGLHHALSDIVVHKLG